MSCAVHLTICVPFRRLPRKMKKYVKWNLYASLLTPDKVREILSYGRVTQLVLHIVTVPHG